MMTKQHFESMATIIREARVLTDTMFNNGTISADDALHSDLATSHIQFRLIDMAKAENTRFDEKRFIRACDANL